MQQHKLEIKGKTFQEDIPLQNGGNSYDMLLQVLILIELGKMIKRGLDNAATMLVLPNGATPENAHIAARNVLYG
jgi:hypothetical protein